MSGTQQKALELKNIHIELQTVYDYIGKMYQNSTQNNNVNTNSFNTMFRMNKKFCAVMLRALPTLQKYAKQFSYKEICDELASESYNYLLSAWQTSGAKQEEISENLMPSYMLYGMIREFKQCRYIDDKFNTNLQKYILNFPDIDKPNFGITATTDQEIIDRFRIMRDKSWNDEGFIDPDGNYYYVGSDHLLTLNWLEAHNVGTMNYIRIANPNNGYFYITNGKDEKTAMQITRKQAKALVTIYRLMKMKRANMLPLSASLFTKSENLGFDKPQQIATGIKNAQTISNYASSEEFDYEQVIDVLKEVKATGRPPVLNDFIVR